VRYVVNEIDAPVAFNIKNGKINMNTGANRLRNGAPKL
jgi:hypothetical protein